MTSKPSKLCQFRSIRRHGKKFNDVGSGTETGKPRKSQTLLYRGHCRSRATHGLHGIAVTPAPLYFVSLSPSFVRNGLWTCLCYPPSSVPSRPPRLPLLAPAHPLLQHQLPLLSPVFPCPPTHGSLKSCFIPQTAVSRHARNRISIVASDVLCRPRIDQSHTHLGSSVHVHVWERRLCICTAATVHQNTIIWS